jgi:hypothetical protein
MAIKNPKDTKNSTTIMDIGRKKYPSKKKYLTPLNTPKVSVPKAIVRKILLASCVDV